MRASGARTERAGPRTQRTGALTADEALCSVWRSGSASRQGGRCGEDEGLPAGARERTAAHAVAAKRRSRAQAAGEERGSFGGRREGRGVRRLQEGQAGGQEGQPGRGGLL